MHILKTSKPIRYAGGTIQPGEWLCNDDNAFQLASMAERGSVEVDKLHTVWRTPLEHSGRCDPCKHALIVRSGAIGDLLLLMPAIAALQKEFPGTDFHLSCFQKHHPILQEIPNLDLWEYPFPVKSLKLFDSVLFLENIVELSTEKGQHATDAYAEALGVTITDYRPIYRVTPEEFARVEYTARTTKKPRVALQLHASSQVRGYPIKQWGQVMSSLVERGWEIMLLGNMDGVRDAPPQVKDCSRLTFREAAAVLSTCDVFCGVDSSFFNLCPALGVPAIGLFGPVDWRTRVKEGSGQRALHGEGCSPCGWTNSRAGSKFPPLGPCFQKQQCVILEDIKPERVVSAIEGAARK